MALSLLLADLAQGGAHGPAPDPMSGEAAVPASHSAPLLSYAAGGPGGNPGPSVPLVELNLASVADLESVAGIGPALSGRLLAERQRAPFENWLHLVSRVKGVGWHGALRLSRGGLRVNGRSHPDDRWADSPPQERWLDMPFHPGLQRPPLEAARSVLP